MDLVLLDWVVREGRSMRLDEEECVAAMWAELAHLTAEELAESAAAARTLSPYLRRFYATWDA